LSQWCIVHRSEAELVVTTWEKQFHSTQIGQKVPLLYLANDILQNSKRQGNEFVQEFWKVLPGALKDIVSLGDDYGKGVVSRLVIITAEFAFFGASTFRVCVYGFHSFNEMDLMFHFGIVFGCL